MGFYSDEEWFEVSQGGSTSWVDKFMMDSGEMKFYLEMGKSLSIFLGQSDELAIIWGTQSGWQAYEKVVGE